MGRSPLLKKPAKAVKALITQALRSSASGKVTMSDGRLLRNDEAMAELLWSVVTTGEVTFPSGRTIEFGGREWRETAKFLYSQIDGDPSTQARLEAGPDSPLSASSDAELALIISAAQRLLRDEEEPDSKGLS